MGLLIFLVVLGLLILIHEYGHFYFARALGVKVERFSIGFGPVVTRIQGKETEYCISAVPLGGYVKLAGETLQEGTTGAPWEFVTRPIWQRFLIIFAGPLSNYLLAFFVFWAIFMIGNPTLTNQVGQLLEGYPANQAGIQAGDRVLEVNGRKVQYWDDVSGEIRRNQGQPLELEIDRHGKMIQVTVTPRVEKRKNLLGQETQTPLIGISPKEEIVSVQYPLWEAMAMAAGKLLLFTQLTFKALWLMITGALPFKESVTGPIGIFYLASGAAKLGLVYVLQIIATISASLAIFNVLPIPVLDGGHLFFLAIEAIKRKPLSVRVQETMTRFGLVFLLLIMVFVFYNDFVRFGIIEKITGMFK